MTELLERPYLILDQLGLLNQTDLDLTLRLIQDLISKESGFDSIPLALQNERSLIASIPVTLDEVTHTLRYYEVDVSPAQAVEDFLTRHHLPLRSIFPSVAHALYQVAQQNQEIIVSSVEENPFSQSDADKFLELAVPKYASLEVTEFLKRKLTPLYIENVSWLLLRYLCSFATSECILQNGTVDHLNSFATNVANKMVNTFNEMQAQQAAEQQAQQAAGQTQD